MNMKLPIRTFVVLLSALLSAMPVIAQQYPGNRPIKIFAPLPPGASTDALARLLAPQLEKRLGQTVVVENRPGAQSTVALQALIAAPKDGHTLLITSAGVHPVIVANNGADIAKETSIITTMVLLPLVFVVNASMPLATVKDLVAYAKANPGKLNYASTGAASVDVTMALFARKVGLQYTVVPYKGPAEAQIAVASGESHMTITTMVSGVPMVQSGKVRALFVTSPERAPPLPDTPTPSEVGIPGGLQAPTHVWLVAPPGTPVEILRRLNTEVAAITRDPDFEKRATGIFASRPIGDSMQDAQAKAEQEIDTLKEAVRLGVYKPR